VKHDYRISKSSYTGGREVRNDEGKTVAVLYTPAVEAAFISGASALRLSVYDVDAGHGLCGNLDEVLS
jgi:hypothetical protein